MSFASVKGGDFASLQQHTFSLRNYVIDRRLAANVLNIPLQQGSYIIHLKINFIEVGAYDSFLPILYCKIPITISTSNIIN